MKKSIIGAAVIFLMASIPACKKEKPAFKTYLVKETPLEIKIAASGKIEPEKIVEIRSKASGELIELACKVGDQVEKGAVIVKIDPRIEQSLLKEAQSKIISGRAGLDRAAVMKKQAQREYSRYSELYKEGAVEKVKFEQSGDQVKIASSELEIAKADLAAAEAGLKDAEVRLEDTVIRAPIRGVILSRSVEVGQVISSATSGLAQGTLLLTMSDLEKIQVHASVDEADIPRLKKGMEASIALDAYPGVEFKGTVSNIWPQASTSGGVSSFPVEVEVTDQRKSSMKPGMRASVEIIVKKIEKCLAVPVESVLERDGKFGVYVLENDQAKWRTIKVGDTGAELIEVRSGIKAGDKVITRGFEQIEK